MIIPTFRRCDVLMETLTALAANDTPADEWEALVVDDGSGDDTVATVRSWAKAQQLSVQCLELVNGGPARARNAGARHGRGELLIFIDNDIVVEPDFVRRHLEVHQGRRNQVVTGRIVQSAAFRRTVFGRYRDRLWEHVHESHCANRLSPTAGVSAANMSLLADDFWRLGGFDEDFVIASSEDWDLARRARNDGYALLYDPLNVVVHNDWADDLRRYCDRQRSYSRSDVLLVRKYGDVSPRAALVAASSPPRRSDRFAVRLRKRLKGAVVALGGERLFTTLAGVSERAVGDSSVTHRLYELSIGCAIFDGVRKGLDDQRAATAHADE